MCDHRAPSLGGNGPCETRRIKLGTGQAEQKKKAIWERTGLKAPSQGIIAEAERTSVKASFGQKCHATWTHFVEIALTNSIPCRTPVARPPTPPPLPCKQCDVGAESET